MHVLELQIEDVAFGGQGVGRHHGKAVFVPFTIDGERVSGRVTREKNHFAEAELADVLEVSDHRTQPECPYFGQCGGCAYQHMTYEHQLAVKAKQVEQTLRRIARLEHVPMRPIIPSPAPYGYRNRITVHADNGLVGYYRYNTHRLVDVGHCPIAAPEVNRALTELRQRRPRNGHYTLRAHPGPRVFQQTNDAVAEALARVVGEMLPETSALLVDAYCGAGFFTKRFRARFDCVVGIEWDRHAVAAAQRDAAAQEQYIAGDVEVELPRELQAADATRTAVIADPSATGLGEAVRRALAESAIQTFVYVSCNPATLARDLGELVEHYELLSVTPLDMFPQTAEIEVAVHLRRRARG